MNAVSLRGENGDFTYSLSGNTVSIAMADESKPGSSLTYADGKLSDPQKQTFAPSTPKQTEQVLAWFEAWSGGNSGHYEMIEYVERSWNGERVAECTIIARAEWLNEVNQGGRITIRGGSVYAYGVVDGAGIGGGEDGDGGIITISGGYVEARGDDYGSGIGAGEDGNGGIITITTTDGPLYIYAEGGSDCGWWAGSIGSNDSDKFGTLILGNGVQTHAWIDPAHDGFGPILVEYNPVAYIQQRKKTILLTCDHPGYTPQTCIYCKH